MAEGRNATPIYDASRNYDYTIKRIVDDGFRLSSEFANLYEFYYNYIMKKLIKSQIDANYITLYNSSLKLLVSHKENHYAYKFMEGYKL